MFSGLEIMHLPIFFHIDNPNFEAPVRIFAMPYILINDGIILPDA